MIRQVARLSLLLLLTVITGNLLVGFAASNSVVASSASHTHHSSTVNEIAPPECAGINLTNIIASHSSTYRWRGRTVYVFEGTAGNDLIIGTDGYDDFISEGGNDCLVGGSGVDYFWAGTGNDVCMALGNNDTFDSCESQQTAARGQSSDRDGSKYQRPK